MYRKLERCIGELRIDHTDREVTKMFHGYFQIVKDVAEEYVGLVAAKDIMADHPEYGFLDEEEMLGILEQARVIRNRCRVAGEKRLTEDDMEELLRRNPDWLDAEADDQGYRIMEVVESTSIEVLAGMVWVCTDSEKITVDKIRQTMLEYLEAKQMKEREADREKRREEIFQKILRETQRRNQIQEDALKLIAEGKHEGAIELLADLDDQIIKDLYQGYWDLWERCRR